MNKEDLPPGKRKILLAGGHAVALTNAIAERLQKEAEGLTVVSLEDKQPDFIKTRECYFPDESTPVTRFINEEKQFICKGKHQYREVEGQWICQCGRKL